MGRISFTPKTFISVEGTGASAEVTCKKLNVIQQIARKVFGAYRDTHQAHIASSLNKAAREFKLSIITLPGIEEILYESELPAADLTRIRKVIKYVKDNPCGATNVVQKRKPISEINAKYNDEPLSDVERKAKVKFNEKAQLSDTKRMDKLEDDREHSHANDIPKIQRLGGGEKLKGKRKFVKEKSTPPNKDAIPKKSALKSKKNNKT